ncbi:MAG: GPI anchored serine-threonine rich family protein [Melioribacteraceae bacterium]|nr:GPI anchored serine-threonine rich family protein [Melioribacteraceae bacterium]
MKKYLVFILLSAIFISCSREDGSNPVIPTPPTDALNVLSPKFGEYYHPGDEIDIKWAFPERIGSVNILLFRKTELKEIIAAGIKNSGQFTWKIPEITDRSVHYRVEIRNANDSTFTVLSDYFYIVE